MPRSSARHSLLLLAAGIAAFLVGLGRRELWNPVEPRYAGICEEIGRTGAWLVPTYGGDLYDQKPPLFFWAGATLLGVADDAEWRRFLVRLPSALGGLALIAGTAGIGRRLWPGRTGLYGGLLLATSWLPFWSSRFCHLDTVAAASTAWALLALLAAGDEGAARVRWIVVGAVALAVGLLVKGPGPIVFTAATAVAYALVTRRPGWLVRSGLAWAVAASVLAGAAWFLPAWRQAGDGWARALLVDSGVLHIWQPRAKHGPLYYVSSIWGVTAPWGLLIAAAVALPARRGDAGDRRGLALCLTWLAVVAVVLHLGSTYRSRYLMPALPPMMLLAGRHLDRRLLAAETSRALTAVVLAPALLVSAAAAVALLLASRLASLEIGATAKGLLAGVADSGVGGVIAGVAILAATVSAAVSIVRSRPRPAIASIVAGLVLGQAAWGLYGAPGADRWRDETPALAVIRRQLAAGRRLVAVGSYAQRESTAGYYGFNLGVPLGAVDKHGRDLAALAADEPLVLLARPRDIEVHPDCVPAGWVRLTPEPLGWRQVFVFINPWPPRRGG